MIVAVPVCVNPVNVGVHVVPESPLERESKKDSHDKTASLSSSIIGSVFEGSTANILLVQISTSNCDFYGIANAKFKSHLLGYA